MFLLEYFKYDIRCSRIAEIALLTYVLVYCGFYKEFLRAEKMKYLDNNFSLTRQIISTWLLLVTRYASLIHIQMYIRGLLECIKLEAIELKYYKIKKSHDPLLKIKFCSQKDSFIVETYLTLHLFGKNIWPRVTNIVGLINLCEIS